MISILLVLFKHDKAQINQNTCTCVRTSTLLFIEINILAMGKKGNVNISNINLS